MAATSGVSFLVKINTGTDASPVWTTIAGQRDATLNMSIDEIDITSKDSSGWHEGLPSIRNWSVDFDALLIEADAGQVAVEAMYLNKTQVKVEVLTVAGTTYIGKATLTDLKYGMPNDAEVTFAGTFMGTGALAKA